MKDVRFLEKEILVKMAIFVMKITLVVFYQMNISVDSVKVYSKKER